MNEQQVDVCRKVIVKALNNTVYINKIKEEFNLTHQEAEMIVVLLYGKIILDS